ncbi:hypothetical protein KCU85_g6917, partial [Aureobasidium melanogenum]
MCDPFNTRIEDALWDERHDIDPFMAEHYATNAQHELDRLAVSQPFSARTAHVRRLHAAYSAIAATAQLPEDSDFDEPGSAEEVETEHLGTVHPDRLALMQSGREDYAPPISLAQGRPPTNDYTNANNSVVPRNAREARRSRESSIESNGFDSPSDHHHDHVDHVKTNQDLQQGGSAPCHDSFQPSTEFHERILAMACMHNVTYTNHSIAVNNGYCHKSWYESASTPAANHNYGSSSRNGRRRGRH